MKVKYANGTLPQPEKAKNMHAPGFVYSIQPGVHILRALFLKTYFSLDIPIHCFHKNAMCP